MLQLAAVKTQPGDKTLHTQRPRSGHGTGCHPDLTAIFTKLLEATLKTMLEHFKWRNWDRNMDKQDTSVWSAFIYYMIIYIFTEAIWTRPHRSAQQWGQSASFAHTNARTHTLVFRIALCWHCSPVTHTHRRCKHLCDKLRKELLTSLKWFRLSVILSHLIQCTELAKKTHTHLKSQFLCPSLGFSAPFSKFLSRNPDEFSPIPSFIFKKSFA